MMTGRKRAVLYIRVSSKEQAGEDKASLEVQQRDCEAYCRRQGYIIVRSPYVDIQSGTDSRKERADFEQMLEDARKDAFDIIVAWRPDRLFRNLWPAARLKKVIDDTGIEVETVTQPMDNSTLGLWAWFAEREIENIRERTMMGRENLAKSGNLATGNPPYGLKYDASIKHLRHEENEKVHVVSFFNWIAEGKSINSLVRYLNELGILTRHGKVWSRQQIVKILKNPIYAGRGYWGKRERRKGRVVAKKSEDESIMVPVDPMISEELFQQVQRQLQKNRIISPRNTKQTYLLQHLLWCRVCGKSFSVRSHVSRNGKPLKTPERYYRCQGMLYSPGAYHCRKPTELNANRIEALVWEKISEAFSNPQSLLEILKIRSKAALEIADNIKKELNRAEEQLRKKNLELQQVLSWARQKLLSPDELKPQLAQVREQKEHWEEEITKLNQKLSSLECSDQNLKDAEQLCRSIGKRLNNLTPGQKSEFLRLVVERIWVDEKNNLEIEVIIPKLQAQPDNVICETALSLDERGK
jgi:site-specific DNA recombinase